MAQYSNRAKKGSTRLKSNKKNRRNRRNKPALSKVDALVELAENQLNQKVEANSKITAQGIAIHSVVNSRTSSTFLQDIRDYNDANLDDRLKVVALSRKLRSLEGVCSTVGDLLVDFGITRGSFYSDNDELKDILNRWAMFINSAPEINVKQVVFPVPGLRALGRKIFNDYITDGDAIFTLFWKTGVKMSEATDEQALFLPITAKVLDTTILEIDVTLAKLGIERISLELSDDIKEAIINPKTDSDKFLSKNVSKEWIKAIKNSEPIILDPNVTFHLKRNAKDYRPWGESLFLKSFAAIANKRRLQAVDESTIDGLINRFTVFKLGLEDKDKNKVYHIPSKARVSNLVNILTDPKRSNAIVWPGPDLKIDDIGPDGKVLEFVAKFKQVDQDILRSLHVSPLLIDGGSSGQSVRDWISFLSTEVGLDAIRDELERIFSKIGRDIAVANNLEYTTITYKYDTQLLKDEKRLRNMALKVYELGGLSTETFLKTMGYDKKMELALKEKEAQDGTTELFVNQTPGSPGTSVDPEGRPLDTTNVERSQPSAPSTQDQNNEAANLKVAQIDLINFNAEFYYSLYDKTFDQIKKDIRIKLEMRLDDDRMLELSIISGFSIFLALVEAQIKEVFFKSIGGRINSGFKDELEFLLNWNREFVGGFFDTMRDKLIEDPSKIESILDNQDHRLRLYANESFRKSIILGEIAVLREKNITHARWITTIDEKTCPICLDNHEKVFTLSQFVIDLPAHPSCRCILEPVVTK